MSMAVQVMVESDAKATMQSPAPPPGPATPPAGQSSIRGDLLNGSPQSRLRDESSTQAERVYSLWTHLSLFATLLVLPPAGCVAPIILWLIRREKSAFIDDHGRELANVVITGAIATAVLAFIPIIGWIPLIFWYVVTGIGVIRGAVAAHRGEFFRYPMVLRFLS